MFGGIEQLRPNLYVPAVKDIPFKYLYSLGYRNYAFDRDNTLQHKGGGLDEEAVEAIREVVRSGFVCRISLISNTITGGEKIRKVRHSACSLGRYVGLGDQVECICLDFFRRKPKPYGFELLKEMGFWPSNTVIVGDQILSDIKGGNKAGFYTILVDPLGEYGWMSVISLRVLRNSWAYQRLKLDYNRPVKKGG